MWYHEARKIIAQVGDGRVFIATWLPASAKAVLSHIDDLADDMHLTFLYVTSGVDTPAKRKKALNAIGRVCQKTEPLKCVLTEMGIMKNEAHTLVANVNITGGSQFYASLVDEIEEAIGHELERDYDFLPHVTVQKKSNGEASIKDLRKFRWTADEITVQFGPNGAKRFSFKLEGNS